MCFIRSNPGRDMAIFRFFCKMAAVRHLGFVMLCVWTTHERHFMVFTAVQNLVGIDAVVVIICTFFDFSSLTGKRLFTPPKLLFWGFAPLGRHINETPQKAHPWAERRHMTYRSSKSVHWCDLCAWWRDQKRKTKTETQQWQTGYSCRIEMKFCMVGGLQMVVLGF